MHYKIKKYDQCQDKIKIAELFQGGNDTIVDSCLQKVMGELFVNEREDAALAKLGDFTFLSGEPTMDLIEFEQEISKNKFRILVPQNIEWEKLIKDFHGEHAKKVIRYAIKKEPEVFDVERLEKVAGSLPKGYALKMIGEEEYQMLRENLWAREMIDQFPTYEKYRDMGLGVVAVYEGEIVAGASSYSRYLGGIEVEIDTREDHRRKGLAYACGARLILECLRRNLYPNWDAENKWSVSLAEKLGYHFDREYIAYEIE